MKVYGEKDVYFQAFVLSVMDGCEWSASHAASALFSGIDFLADI